jgi:hypothetical protein
MVMLVVVVVVVSACSGDSSDTSDGPTDAPTSSSAGPAGGGSDAPEATTTSAEESGGSVSLGAPCSFLTDPQMSEILGKDVTSEASGDLLCIYAPADGSGGIELLLQDVSDVGCELVFSVGGFDDEEPVEGVGTYAKYKVSGVSQMAVCYNELVTLAMTMYAEPTDPKAVLIAVATAVEQGLS